MSKPPKDLPPDWFCEDQTSLLDLISEMARDAKEEEQRDSAADADPV